ncbi:hypothetical protein [Rhodococcus opacus]|uniref:hypothetical protein n=1 Tax=Rhodococcus opacus TaxID=37919 RepID=UPI001C470329|nr:hypothetical protein [Rhodococcus opacus]MBV6758367.1 hypothetical protein [Rhodococcus opacus]
MARMLGKSSLRPYVYGAGTGRMKKCFGCLDGCGYAADNQTQRQREKRAVRNWLDEYEERTPLDCPKNDYRLQGSNELLAAVRCLC